MAKHLTPDERAKIVARYQELANASAVAAEFGVSVHTVIRSVERAGAAKKDTLHAQACARGVREGRRALVSTARLLGAWLSERGRPDAPTMEPGDVARISQSLRGVVSGVVECDEHQDRKKLSRLSRDKSRLEMELKRAEIELARLKIAAGGVEQHSIAVSVADAASAAAEVFGSPSNLVKHAGGTSGGDGDGGSDA